MNDPVSALLGSRRDRLGQVLGRYLVPVLGVTAPAHVRQHLMEEATELYWNELEWEHITHDAGDDAIERCFAGLLSFVRAPPGSGAAPRPRAVPLARALPPGGRPRRGGTLDPLTCG